MKIITATEMLRIENLAYEDGLSDEKFMLRVAKAITKKLIEYISEKKLPEKIIVLAGKGNNAGDGYVIANLLLKKGFRVTVYQLFSINEASFLCKKHHQDFIKKDGKVVYTNQAQDLYLDKKSFILDAIFGTGFKGEIKGSLLNIIKKVNNSNLKIVSIDIPSGLNGDTGKINPIAIKANITMYLEFVKLGFFINDGPNYIGNLDFIDFKLPEKYKNLAKNEYDYMDKINLKEMLPKIERKRHKYQAGYVVGIAGSKGMFGAAKLAALAALRSGCGIVKMITQEEILSSFYELVNFVMDYKDTEEITNLCNKADSIFLGPGIGRDKKIEKFLSKLLPKLNKKVIIDADALFHLSNTQYTLLPHDCVLTPHRKEMLRLLNVENIDDEELIKKTLKFSQDKNILIVLKGYPTIIFHPQKKPITILGGDPGLATAGTGDVLTGMIASFASQKLDLYTASILSVKLHFKAAEKAALEKTSYGLIATDIIESLPKVFKELIQ
jgi:NAD(P)H-hydrate epimerase